MNVAAIKQHLKVDDFKILFLKMSFNAIYLLVNRITRKWFSLKSEYLFKYARHFENRIKFTRD